MKLHTLLLTIPMLLPLAAQEPQTLSPAEYLEQRNIKPEKYNEFIAFMNADYKEAVQILKCLIACGADVNYVRHLSEHETTTPLFQAARHKNAEFVRVLLKAGADPNLSSGSSNEAPLIRAVKESTPEIVAMLLAAGANPNAQDEDGNTAYHFAKRKPELLRMLYAAGANPAILNKEGRPALLSFGISGDGNRQMFENMLQAGSDINLTDAEGNTLLHLSETRKDIGISIEDILIHGADINAQNNQGQTPLMLACRYDKNADFITLLEHGADISLKDKSGKTALDYAAKHFCFYNHTRLYMQSIGQADKADVTGELHLLGAKYRDLYYDRVKTEQFLRQMQELLAAGANPNIPNIYGGPFIFQVIGKPYAEQAVRLLLQYGADVIHAKDDEGNTPLHCASDVKVIRLLLAEGADVHAVNDSGETPLIAATRRNADAAIQLLLEAGADPNARDHEENTALHYAVQVEEGQTLIPILMKAGADINARNKDGVTPLMFCAAEDWHKNLTELSRGQLNINAKDNSGFTALHYAAQNGYDLSDLREVGATTGNALEDAILYRNVDAVQKLIAEGTHINSAGARGYTPLHWAAIYESPELIRLLLQAGANVNAQNEVGETPLLSLIRNNHHEHICESAELLIQAGASVTLRDRDGESIIAAAVQCNVPPQLLRLLFQAGANPNEKDNEGTPLIITAAAYRDTANDAILRVLLEFGADIYATDADGRSVFDIGPGSYECMQLLEEARKQQPQKAN